MSSFIDFRSDKMTKHPTNCPKCEGRMEQGYVPDHAYSSILVGKWHPGPPPMAFWSETKAPAREGIPMGAFRCDQCGYLEFYARHEFSVR
ncbi:MAG: hypothetical protein ACPG4K_08185 [Haloferula sp.]